MTSLVKKLDSEGAKGLKSFVIYLSDDENLSDELKSHAEKIGLKNTVLAIDNVTGPKAWNIAKEAEVTVMLYSKRKVQSNYCFAEGKLDDKAVAAVVADLPKILVAKKDAD